MSDSQGYGCHGLCITESVVAVAKVALVDASCSTFFLVHTSLKFYAYKLVEV